jgi:hypothetical protein
MQTHLEVLMSRLILSAAALDIDDAEHRAMLEIRELFANGIFHHDVDAEADKPDGFNMDYPDRETECGTTCCIGGWMFRAMQRDRTTRSLNAGTYVSKDRSPALAYLFHPPFEDIDDMAYSDITPGAALAAIDSFLATGNPNWQHACGLHLTDTTA